jgi:transcriptional regulator with XRE-family HTH domain
MSKSHLSRIERGERSPTLNEVLALADALQISVSELTRLPVPALADRAVGLAEGLHPERNPFPTNRTAALRRSTPFGCSVTHSSATPSRCCSATHGGMRSARRYGAWPAGPV